ncbi:hypothetical protein AQUCO_00200882v1 [Aquilegia coerulea]|uniref:Mitochondrial import receptor subunit TOM5 homolog n=1 Tax=Aquilegia coerulea TaxID=218851 RepID=A0A2G5F599_AQUCA|nr:hypothetical protein AQUCO_00200882v1 [Aquilegia coerulea]
MADTVESLKNLKELILSQYYDDDKWDMNAKLLRAAGLFAGSIYLMRNFGDLAAI